MENFENLIYNFNGVSVIIRLLAALFIGALIGSERGRHGRAAGLRTHILVCIGSAMTSLTSLFLVNAGLTTDVTRISAQVVSGIGFLGAGMILIRNNSVITGLTTAAGMWTTAVIGISIGYGFYLGALVAAMLSIFSVTVFSYFERRRRKGAYLYIELFDLTQTGKIIEFIKNFDGSLDMVDITPPKSGTVGNVGVLCLTKSLSACDELKSEIDKLDGVSFTIDNINI